ncbi:hypothetical protein AX16_004692 [Volvariella volvacea WC 439]|nr:hypothetical protein AX16_004692 [Volvariella volvacea WC 439]
MALSTSFSSLLSTSLFISCLFVHFRLWSSSSVPLIYLYTPLASPLHLHPPIVHIPVFLSSLCSPCIYFTARLPSWYSVLIFHLVPHPPSSFTFNIQCAYFASSHNLYRTLCSFCLRRHFIFILSLPLLINLIAISHHRHDFHFNVYTYFYPSRPCSSYLFILITAFLPHSHFSHRPHSRFSDSKSIV